MDILQCDANSYTDVIAILAHQSLMDDAAICQIYSGIGCELFDEPIELNNPENLLSQLEELLADGEIEYEEIQLILDEYGVHW